ncbi:hypothetical protein [Kitasatospora purpeofusca]|uniref:hypothetical protein n=1 Tax=Kitasatospora purpeofusca TaxID=67352 RepID=UPI0035DFD5FA
MEYLPRSPSDGYPWAVHDEPVDAYTYLRARACVSVWPDGTWENSSGEVVTRDKPWTPYTVVYHWCEDYRVKISDPYWPDPKGEAFQVWAPDVDSAGDFAEVLAFKKLGDEAVHLEHVVCLRGHAYAVGD